MYNPPGKICSTEGRDLMTEEEDAEGLPDPRSLDIPAHTSLGWMRTNKRTQILPEGEALIVLIHFNSLISID